jgi:hypothetical protein
MRRMVVVADEVGAFDKQTAGPQRIHEPHPCERGEIVQHVLGGEYRVETFVGSRETLSHVLALVIRKRGAARGIPS